MSDSRPHGPLVLVVVAVVAAVVVIIIMIFLFAICSCFFTGGEEKFAGKGLGRVSELK